MSSKQVQIRLSPEDVEQLDTEARAIGVSRSDVIRMKLSSTKCSRSTTYERAMRRAESSVRGPTA
jgi:hypothetical protein